jgi:hypothetical protein
MLKLRHNKTGEYVKADTMGTIWCFETKAEAELFLKAFSGSLHDFTLETVGETDERKNGLCTKIKS